MSTEWTARQILDASARLVERPASAARFNPRPQGVVRPGSATEAVLELLMANRGRLYWRWQVIGATGRTRKAVDHALLYLVATRRVEAVTGAVQVAVSHREASRQGRLQHLRFRLLEEGR